MSIFEVGEPGGVPYVLAYESQRDSSTQQSVHEAHVFKVSATGHLVLDASLPDLNYVLGFNGDYIVQIDHAGTLRLDVRSGSNWLSGPALSTYWFGNTGFRGCAGPFAMDSERLVQLTPPNPEMVIKRLNGMAPPSVEAVLPMLTGHINCGMVIDRDLMVAYSKRYTNIPDDHEDGTYRIFERSSAGSWSEVLPRITPPPQADWTTTPSNFDVSEGRIAIRVSGHPEAFIYERGSAGSFEHTHTVASTRQLEVAPGVVASRFALDLRGDELLMTTGMDSAGELYRWDGFRWAPQARLQAGQSGWSGSIDLFEWKPYRLLEHHVIATASAVQLPPVGGVGGGSGIQVMDRVTAPFGVEITCTSAAQTESLVLGTHVPYGFSHHPIRGGINASDRDSPLFLLASRSRGHRPLGAESTLCLGGPITMMPGSTPQSYLIDPVAAAIAPGETIYLQGWQYVPGLPGGRTSNALAVTFAP